jgi:hypothetical protein
MVDLASMFNPPSPAVPDAHAEYLQIIPHIDGNILPVGRLLPYSYTKPDFLTSLPSARGKEG